MMCSEYSQFSEITQNPSGQNLTKGTQQTENVKEFTDSFKKLTFFTAFSSFLLSMETQTFMFQIQTGCVCKSVLSTSPRTRACTYYTIPLMFKHGKNNAKIYLCTLNIPLTKERSHTDDKRGLHDTAKMRWGSLFLPAGSVKSLQHPAVGG